MNLAKDSGARLLFAEEVCDWSEVLRHGSAVKACCWAVFAGRFGMATGLHLSLHPIMISLECH